jgi:hypothetical protein
MPNRAKNHSAHDKVHDSDEEQSRANQPGGVAQETRTQTCKDSLKGLCDHD